MIMICLITTLAIYLSYHYALSLRGGDGILHRVLSASLLTCAQIILTELSLGLLHGLYLPVVLIVNIAISAVVAAAARRRGAGNVPAVLREDALRISAGVASAIDVPIAVLLVLAALTYGWILAAAYFLPPRGFDDLMYHLPAIFEYVRSHEIRLLPVDQFWPFAYPENAELLFLWPVLFTHAQTWVDGANLPFAVLSTMTVFALLRRLGIGGRNALFAALLYVFCPVVLMQAGVNYVDIVVSLFLLLSLYFSIVFYERKRDLDLYLAGLSIGLMCGMKYTGVFLALPLLALIIPALSREKWRPVVGFAMIALLAGGWWYIRNWHVLGDPFYPARYRRPVPDAYVNINGGNILQNIKYNLPYWISRYPLTDVRVGSYDGGFGLVFWGMGFPSWLYAAARSFFLPIRTKLPVFVVLTYMVMGFLLLLMLPPRMVEWDGRFSLFVVAVGLYAFCEVLRRIGDKALVAFIKVLCIALSLFSVSFMTVSTHPSYRIADAIADVVDHAEPHEFKYLADSTIQHVLLWPVWDALDVLSRDDPAGLNCSLASDDYLYEPAPIYGTRLQNRVLNLDGRKGVPVDAYVCTYLGEVLLSKPFPVYDSGRMRPMAIRDVMAKDDYIAVLVTDHACLMLRRDIYDRPDKQRLLQAYYRNSWPEAVAVAENIAPRFDADIPLVTSSDIGYGFRYVDMRRGRRNRVYLSLKGKEGEVAARIGAKQCYTLQSPLAGYSHRRVMRVVYGKKSIDMFLNRRPS